ncbi:MAG: sulfite exporter TauE/SafE family protein [Oscillospiraceae bacterium]|jgi:uncharacterized membrane protein YfcA|nr:sulfite exporter TauE/SafE family protein [Oscillospiraceae bacterium]
MTDKSKDLLKKGAGGTAVGFINGLLGAGGGMVVVPLLKKLGLPQLNAHATAVAVIFPLSILSTVVYLLSGRFELAQAAPYLLPGAVGALGGALLLSQIPQKWLRKVFAVFMIWAGVRMFLR